MSKSKWWVAVLLGLVASSGAMASEAGSDSSVKSVSTNERQASISSVDSVSYMAAATNSSQGSTGASKLPSAASYDSSIGPGPSSLPFILAGFGALAVAATRRRPR
jgi:hypothetical protein